MKRKIFSILFALVLVFSFSLVAAVPVSASPDISIDGVLGEPEWGEPAFVEESYFSVYLLNDTENLYVAYKAEGGSYLEGSSAVGFMTATLPDGAFAWSYSWGTGAPDILGAQYFEGGDEQTFDSEAEFAVKATVFELQVPLSELLPISLGDTVMVRFLSFSEGLTDWENCWLPGQAEPPLEYTLPAKVQNENTGFYYETIQDAINAASPGDTINVAAGAYNERLTISESLDLRGAQYEVDPTLAGARTNPDDESTIDVSGLSYIEPHIAVEVSNGVNNVAVDGFTIIGIPNKKKADDSVIACGRSGTNNDITISNNVIDGNVGILFNSGDSLTVQQNDITFNKNAIVIHSGCTAIDISDNTMTGGTSMETDPYAIYITSTTGSITGNTIENVIGPDDRGKGISGSSNYDLLIDDNIINNTGYDGISFWSNTHHVTISNNTLSNNAQTYTKGGGITIKGDDLTIIYNDITGSGHDGVVIDTDVLTSVRIDINYNNIWENADYGINVKGAGETVDATSNWWGDASGPYHEATNPTATGDPVSDNVHYSPWCAADDADPVAAGYQAPALMVWGVSTDGTIQEAIDDFASSGDTINVAAGTYLEHILIDEALTVKSTDGAEQTIIDSIGFRYIVSIIHSDVTFEGFTVTDPTYVAGSDATGILIYTVTESVSNVQILDNIITQVRSETGNPSMFGPCGINVGYAVTKGNNLSDIVISGNTITDIKNPSEYTSSCSADHTCGINIWDGAENVEITNNDISDIKFNGIILEHAINVRIEGNSITECKDGIRVQPSVTVSGLTVNFNNIAGNTEYGVANFDLALSVDAENNWWGATNGPSGVGPGDGDAVSDNVDYDPWFGAEAKVEKTETGDDTVDATTKADTKVIKSGSGTPTITAAKYSSNPGTGFSGDIGKYIDVHVDDPASDDEIEIRLYYTNPEIAGRVESSLRLLWWNGTSWVACSVSGVNTTDIAGTPAYSGYMWAKVTSDTVPTLAQLSGTPFSGHGGTLPPPPPPAVTLESIAASPSSVTLGVDETQQLTVTATYSDESTDNVTAEASYESSDTSVTTVSNAGLITGVAEGSATITVSYETKTDTVSVTVIAFTPWSYDEDGDGVIDISEALVALADYFDGLITIDQALDVIALYFAS